MKISNNLRKLRSKTNYSQQYIADILGVDKNTYAKWENGYSDVKSEHIPKIAELFDVSINDLFKPNNKNFEINFNKQIHKDNSINNSIVFVSR